MEASISTPFVRVGFSNFYVVRECRWFSCLFRDASRQRSLLSSDELDGSAHVCSVFNTVCQAFSAQGNIYALQSLQGLRKVTFIHFSLCRVSPGHGKSWYSVKTIF